jgi:hypothetical protein
MSEYQLIDIYYTANDSLANLIMNFVSILSGYLLATYFLGNKITKGQFLILTTSYLAIMGITIQAIYTRIEELSYITRETESLQLDWWTTHATEPVALFLIVCAHFFILVGSLYFGVLSVRRSDQ